MERRQTITYDKLALDHSDEVYTPSDDTFLLADYIRSLKLKGRNVLEVGCGIGLLSLIAAKKGAHVIATDLNPHATCITKTNTGQNRLDHLVDIIRCDLQTAIRPCTFNYVIFNPPYLPVEEEKAGWLSISWSGGKEGMQTIKRFLQVTSQFMDNSTRILMVVSSATSMATLEEQCEKLNLQLETVKQKDFFFEKLFLLRIEKEEASHTTG